MLCIAIKDLSTKLAGPGGVLRYQVPTGVHRLCATAISSREIVTYTDPARTKRFDSSTWHVVIKRLKTNACGNNLPGGLTGTGKGPKQFETKGPDATKAPLGRGKRNKRKDDE